MKKYLILLALATLLVNAAEALVLAAPEPTKIVEVFLRPGIDLSQYKTMGTDPAVSIKPMMSWSVDSGDPFFRMRIKEGLENSMKRQGFLLAGPTDADLKLKVTIRQWGRLRNSQDLNLMEFVELEAKVYAAGSGELILRATGKYSRVDPLENTPDKMNEALGSLMDEILSSLRPKPAKADGKLQEASTELLPADKF